MSPNSLLIHEVFIIDFPNDYIITFNSLSKMNKFALSFCFASIFAPCSVNFGIESILFLVGALINAVLS